MGDGPSPAPATVWALALLLLLVVCRGGRPCPPGCEAHGNCDESTARCQCPLGRGGPDCSRNELPECRLTDNITAPCFPYVPMTCGCLRQCAHLAARHGLRVGSGVCYDVSSSEERAAVVHAPAEVAGKAMWANVRSTGCSIEDGLAIEVTLQPISPSRKEWVPVLERRPVQECPRECSQRGFCQKSGTCRCYGHNLARGKDCGQEAFHSVCPAGCSGRGVCQLGGFCRCIPGHWGIDCALSLDNATGAVRLWDGYTPGAEVSPRVYVYDFGDNPIHLNKAFFLGSDGWGGDYGRTTESLLRERLLSSRHRTVDPEAADFFYISNSFSVTAHEAIRAVRRLPYFERRGGRDHLMYTGLDGGTDEMFNSPCWRGQPRSDGTALPDFVKGVAFMQHMGQRVGTRAQGVSGDGNFREDRDILLPPLQPTGRALLRRFSPYMGSPEAVRQSSSRSGDLFFAGGVKMNDAGGDGRVNVRREIFQAHMGKPGFALSPVGLKSIIHYYGNMTSARFCLSPPGTGGGWGRRTTLVALFGCIPVIVQDGRINEPFAELFAPESYTVRVAEEDIPRMGEILRGLSQGQIERMQRELACLWPRWMYSSMLGATGDEGVEDDVFAGLMMLLRRRLEGKKEPFASACDVLSPALKAAIVGGGEGGSDGDGEEGGGEGGGGEDEGGGGEGEGEAEGGGGEDEGGGGEGEGEAEGGGGEDEGEVKGSTPVEERRRRRRREARQEARRMSRQRSRHAARREARQEARQRSRRRPAVEGERPPGGLCREEDCLRLDAHRLAAWGARLFEAGLLSERPVVNRNGRIRPVFLKMRVAAGGAACVGQGTPGPPC